MRGPSRRYRFMCRECGNSVASLSDRARDYGCIGPPHKRHEGRLMTRVMEDDRGRNPRRERRNS